VRKELVRNPLLLLERIGEIAHERRRLKRLKFTEACDLNTDHIESLELLDCVKGLKPQVIYDIGANRGTWTSLCRYVFPSCHIHAFEPLDAHCQLFRARTKGSERITLHGVALGRSDGTAPMNVTSFSDASSMLSVTDIGETTFGISVVEQVPIQIRTLDGYCPENRLPAPDLMKLDVQGYELEVLRGAVNALKHCSAIISEVSFKRFYKEQCLFEDVVGFLYERSFRLSALGVRTALGVELEQADVLFVKI